MITPFQRSDHPPSFSSRDYRNKLKYSVPWPAGAPGNDLLEARSGYDEHAIQDE
jgi:hypothetical protein